MHRFKRSLSLTLSLLLLMSLITLSACRSRQPQNTVETTKIDETQAIGELPEATERPETGPERVARINRELREIQRYLLEPKPKKHGKSQNQLMHERAAALIEERRIVREARRGLAEKRSSIGQIYPPNSLVWNQILITYIPCPKELMFDGGSGNEKALLGQQLIDQGYVVEELTPFSALDDEASHYIGHNRNPGFLPFMPMQIGDRVYITGADGWTYEYIVVDNVETRHAGPDYFTEDGLIQNSIDQEVVGIHSKLTGKGNLSRYETVGVESVGLTWCRDDFVIEGFFAIPVSDYQEYQRLGIID